MKEVTLELSSYKSNLSLRIKAELEPRGSHTLSILSTTGKATHTVDIVREYTENQ